MNYGTIKSVGNGQVDVQLTGSAGVMRNVQISAQVNWNTLALGMKVLVDNVNGRPVVLHTIVDVPQFYTSEQQIYAAPGVYGPENALLADGSVPLTGNLYVTPGVTIDGYDISVLGQSIDNLQAADSVARTGYTVMTHASHIVEIVTAADTQVKIRHNLFLDKEILAVSNTNGDVEFMRIVGQAVAAVDDHGVLCYLYTVTRRVATSPANLVTGWAAATLVNGLTHRGYIAFDARTDRDAAPSMRFVLHTDIDAGTTEQIVRIGALSGILDYADEDYGFAIGKLTTADKYLIYSYADNRFRIRGADFSGEDETGTEAFRIWGIAEGGRVPGDFRFGPVLGGHQEWSSESQRLSIFNGANEVIYFSPTESRFKNMVWAGSEAGPQIGIGELDGQGIIVARNALDVAQFVVRTQQDGVYIFGGNPKPQAGWLEFDNGLTVDGTIRARALEIIGAAVVGDDTSEIIIRDPADPRRYGHIKPHYMAGYSVDSTDTQHLSSLIAWAPATLEAAPGSNQWHTWLAGEGFFGDWRYRHFRWERNGRVGMFDGETPKAWMDYNGDFHASGEIIATAGLIGGWTIGPTALTAGLTGPTIGLSSVASTSIWVGDVVPGNAAFQVSNSGQVYATAGAIGGWAIGATTLLSANGEVQLSSVNGLNLVSDDSGRESVSNTNAVNWYDELGFVNRTGRVYGSLGITEHVLVIESDGLDLGYHGKVAIYGTGGAAKSGNILLRAEGNNTDLYGAAIGISCTGSAGGSVVSINSDFLNVTGVTKLGDGGLTNYAQFAANGTLSMVGTAAIAGYLPVTGAITGATVQAQTFTNGVLVPSSGKVGVGIATPQSALHAVLVDAETALYGPILTLGHNTSGTPATYFGGRLALDLKSTTTENRPAAWMDWQWADPTHGAETAGVTFWTAHGADMINVAKFGGNLGTVLNEDGNAWNDLRVEGDTDTHLIFADASADRVGIGASAPRAKLDVVGDVYAGGIFVGAGAPSGNGSPIIIGELVGGAVNVEAFRDESIVTAVGSGMYNSFDAAPALAGSVAYGHYHGFQSRPTYSSSGKIVALNGFWAHPILNGPAASVRGLHIEDATGSSTIDTQYGIRIEELTKGAANFAIYSAGAAPSYHSGDIQGGGRIYTSESMDAPLIGVGLENTGASAMIHAQRTSAIPYGMFLGHDYTSTDNAAGAYIAFTVSDPGGTTRYNEVVGLYSNPTIAAVAADNWTGYVAALKARVSITAASGKSATTFGGYGLHVEEPCVGGAGTKQIVDSIGVKISNQGNAAFNNAYGLKIEAQSGAAANYALVVGGGPVVLNEDGTAEGDLRVESDNYDALFVDASNDSIAIMNHAGGKVGFYAAAPIVKQTGVPVTAAGIHAALVALGLITA